MKKILSSVTAAALGLMSLSLCGNSVHATSPEPGDWIPHSFAEAMTFQNIYGAAHIDNYPGGPDIACFVMPYSTNINCIFDFDISGENVKTEYAETFFEPRTDIAYRVLAVSDPCKSPDSFEISFGSDGENMKVYSFSSDGNGGLTETDDYSWIPDCWTEYREFEKEHGTLSVVNNYVAFCSQSIPGAGYSWEFSQKGKGKLKEYLERNCNERYIYPMDGGASLDFVLYKAESEGEVNAEWKYCRSWDPDSVEETIEKTYEISSDFEIKETGIKVPEFLAGDVNCDGVLAVNDALSLQKYLLGMSESEDDKWENADMNGDGIVNIIDFCLVKSTMIIPEPEVLNTNPLAAEGEINGHKYKLSAYSDYNSGYFKRGYIDKAESDNDFNYGLLICMGEETTGGYGIYVTDIQIDNKNNLIVFVNETSPGPDEMVTQAFTYPCCKVSLDMTPAEINSVSVRTIYGSEFNRIAEEESVY